MEMGSQMELYNEFMQQREKFEKALPDLMAMEKDVWNEAYKDGALSAKVKRLIALGIALRAACTSCIIGQTIRAIEAGATREEVVEACSVALMVGGTTGLAESYRVMKLLDEMGK